MIMIYMIYAANLADVIEVPLGANVQCDSQGDGIGILCDYSYALCVRSSSEERF